MIKFPSGSKGFTFIELIIVFTVTTILGTVGVASLIGYSQRQEVVTATQDLRNLFLQARAKAVSQIKPDQCPTDLSNPNNNSTLLGYEVDFCAGASRPVACKATDDYEVNAKCDNGYWLVTSRKYSSQMSITSKNSYNSYFFSILTGRLNHADTVTLSRYGTSQTIVVDHEGVIQ